MWHLFYQNSICNQLEKLTEQRLHVERVLSIKGQTDSSCPHKPKFLKTKLKKLEMEEEEKEKIEYENQNLLMRIINAEIKPSKYSINYTPKDCPAFNKKRMYEKRIEKEYNNYKCNVSLYSKISKIKSNYDTKTIYKNSSLYDKIVQRIKKPDRTLHPCLYFQSPTFFINQIKKQKHNNIDINKSSNETERGKKSNSAKITRPKQEKS